MRSCSVCYRNFDHLGVLKRFSHKPSIRSSRKLEVKNLDFLRFFECFYQCDTLVLLSKNSFSFNKRFSLIQKWSTNDENLSRRSLSYVFFN